MKELDYIALIALFISFASMWLSLNAYRRTSIIEKEEKRRKVFVEIMIIQPRINSILSRAKAYIASAMEVKKCATAHNSAKTMNEMVVAIEDMKMNYHPNI